MPDARFYEMNREIALRDIAAQFSLELGKEDPETKISSINSLENAQPGDLTFCDTAPNSGEIQTNATAVLIREKHAPLLPKNSVPLICAAPRAMFARISGEIMRQKLAVWSAKPEYCEENAKIAPNALFGGNNEIGQGTRIAPNVTIGAGVTIGRNCDIGSGVSIECAHIGDNVKIGANSVIGKTGFGVVLGEKPTDIPHFGRVIIQDNVTIGALCTIDRGVFADTIIGMNSKLDNLCHIAHNVKMGQGVVIAAYGGISGSVEIGDFVIMGGRVGIADHIKIGEKAILSAGTIVSRDVPKGENWGGYPAKPKMQWLKELVRLEKLGKFGK